MTDPASLDPAPARPTHVRHWVVLTTMLMSILLYLDRFCISFTERLIKEDMGLTNEQMGWILSAFFWSYALAQVPSGWLSDRFGPRAMLTLYILLWSLFTALTGLVAGFVTLIVMRLGFGLAQAGAYPTASGVVSQWTPVSSRGKASAVVAFGGRIGGFLAPVATAYLIVTLVPADASSRLTESDLLDVGHFSRQLEQPDPQVAPVSARVMERLSPDAPSFVQSQAQPGAAALAPPQIERLVGDLNRILADASLYDPQAFAGMPLPKEASQLLKQQPADLSPRQVERLNRLLLETAYPLGIKKVYVAGWRPVLWVYGAVGALVAGLFWLVVRDTPRQHPACSDAEINLIESGRPRTGAAHRVEGIPLRRLVQSRSLWLSSISQAGTNVGWVFLVTWLPRYLGEAHRVPVETRGWMTAIPLFVGWFGMLYGGRLTDRMVDAFGLRWGRALPMGLSRFLCAAAFLFCLLPLGEWFGAAWAPWLMTAAFSLVAFGTDLGVPATWAFTQDAGGRHVGSVLGWGNMWGNLGAAVSPPLLNWVIGPSGADWSLAFLTCAAAFVIAGVAALGIDATVPIVPKEDDEG